MLSSERWGPASQQPQDLVRWIESRGSFISRTTFNASVESFEPLFQETPISHTVSARAGSGGGFCAQVKNSWPEVLVTWAALQRALPGQWVPPSDSPSHEAGRTFICPQSSFGSRENPNPDSVGESSLTLPSPFTSLQTWITWRRGKMRCPPLFPASKKITSSSLRFSKGCEFTLNPGPHFMLLLGVQASWICMILFLRHQATHCLKRTWQ